MSFKLMAALPAKLLVGSLGILAMMVPAEAAAQSTSSVPGVGPHQAAAPIVFADPTAGECESQTLTSYVPPTSTLKGIFYFPWHEASGECTNSSTSYWCACVWRGKPGAPRAAAGLYDSATATVIDGHMQTIASKGLEVVGIEWTRQNNTLDQIALGQIPGDPKGVVGYAAGLRGGPRAQGRRPL